MFDYFLFNTKRAGYLSATAQTTGQDYYLQDCIGNLRPMGQNDYTSLPEAALAADWLLELSPTIQAPANASLDIGKDDQLVNIRLRATGQQWEDDIPVTGQANAALVFWRVVYAEPTRPGPLAHKRVCLKRVSDSGPFHR